MRKTVRLRQSATMRRAGLIFLMLSGCATVPAKPPEIPVSQVGVAFDREGEMGSFAEGLADPAAGRAVTPDDPVRIASVSKLVVAIGTTSSSVNPVKRTEFAIASGIASADPAR